MKISYIDKKIPNTRGFTIIESMIVISIIALIASASISSFRSMHDYASLKESQATVLHALEHAKNKSASGVGTSDHGVRIEESRISVFEGESYDSDNASTYPLQAGITTNIISAEDIIFQRLSGKTNQGLEIQITNRDGETKRVYVSEEGAISGDE